MGECGLSDEIENLLMISETRSGPNRPVAAIGRCNFQGTNNRVRKIVEFIIIRNFSSHHLVTII